MKVLKSKKKKASTNLVLLPWLRNKIGCFMKTYFHKPINISQFLSRGKIQKFLT